MNHPKYIFKSNRLGFRNWTKADEYEMCQINLDETVMEFFPSIQNEFQTQAFIERMQQSYEEHGYCYFAADILETNQFIGFIGLLNQDYESEFTPCVDIGWRLSVDAWNCGYATEGAKRCLEFAFQDLKLEKIYAVAPIINKKSICVMEKIGMQQAGIFIHPYLINDDRLKSCVYYEIEKKAIDKRNRLITNPFTYKIAKDDKVIIYRDNKQIMIVKGSKSVDLISVFKSNDEEQIQLALAKITGHYKHGNER